MNENVNVCITPKGEKPVLHFSQFDNENVFTVTVLADDGESAAVLTGLDIEFRLRKTDSHVVTIAPESVADNVITFKTTEQLCACCGQNIASVVLMKDDMIISTLDILVDIQRDILSGGLTSESDIRNLTTQIEQIVPEVVGDDYYNKQEVDDLLAEHTFDPTNYYNKSDVDDLLADKADSDDVMSKVTRHGLGGDTPYYSFDNNCVAPMDNIECAVTPVQSGSGTPSPDNIRPISGHSSCTITVADSDDTPVNTCTVSFGQTVYGGVVDVTSGKVNVAYAKKKINELTWNYVNIAGSERFYSTSLSTVIEKATTIDIVSTLKCSCYETVSERQYAQFTSNNIIAVQTTGFVVIRDTNYTSVSDLLNAVGEQEICYPLATPTEVTFTPATTDTINGHNKVSSSTGNMKSLTYFSDVNSDLVDLIRACMIGR